MKIPYIEINKRYAKNIGSIKVALPPIDFFLKKIKEKEHFQYVKHNHGFFDQVSRHLNEWTSIPDLANRMYPKRYAWQKNVSRAAFVKCVRQTCEDLKGSKLSYLFIGISDSNGLYGGICPYPSAGRHRKSYQALYSLIKTSNPRPYLLGGIFRHYVVTGEMKKMFEILKNLDYSVIVVGPKHCQKYRKYIGEFSHVVIPGSGALESLNSITQDIQSSLNPNKHNVIFASCALMSFALGRKMRNGNSCETTFIDVGRSFDFYLGNDGDSCGQPWLQAHRIGEWKPQVLKIRKGVDCFIKQEQL